MPPKKSNKVTQKVLYKAKVTIPLKFLDPYRNVGTGHEIMCRVCIHKDAREYYKRESYWKYCEECRLNTRRHKNWYGNYKKFNFTLDPKYLTDLQQTSEQIELEAEVVRLKRENKKLKSDIKWLKWLEEWGIDK